MRFPRNKLIFIVAILTLSQTSSNASSVTFLEVLATIAKSKIYVLTTNNDEFFEPKDTSNNPIDYGTYDFIIVGGGAAGGVLANRLTETDFTVLVIEAGKEDPRTAAILGLALYFVDSEYNWGYNTVSQKRACLGVKNQSCLMVRGKTLGGSSVINLGLYARGNAADFDRWAALGNTGWSYKDCLPYFKKSEMADFTIDIDREYHGFKGPQNINVVNDTPRLTPMLLEAFKELGLTQGDYNGRYQYQVSRSQNYIDYNIRSSTAHAFLRPIENRSNLHITLESFATKIQIQNGKAVGVEFVKRGKKYFAKARKEVIVSAGSINSPQILMLSGIGPAKELNKHKIKVLANLPVGEYLSDHLFSLAINYRSAYGIEWPNSDLEISEAECLEALNGDVIIGQLNLQLLQIQTTNDYFKTNLLESYILWKKAKRPLNIAAQLQVVSYWNLTGSNGEPQDIGIYVLQALGAQGLELFRFTDEYVQAYETINIDTDILPIVYLFHPKSLGKVTLQSKDPRDFPLIDPNYFSDPSDLENMYKGIQIILKLNNTENFRKTQTKFILPSFPGCDEKYKKMSKEWWYCGLQRTSYSLFHPLGTTRMGTSSKNSVVTSELKVHGIDRLRIVDAGVIPAQFTGHPNAVVVMIAEKISDVIKAEYSNK